MATEITERHVQHRQPGGFNEEIVRGTVDTDGTGAGSLTVPLDGYGESPVVQITSDAGAAANVTANSFDFDITGGTASSTVDVEALVHGPGGIA